MQYPEDSLYMPDRNYPEYPFINEDGGKKNSVYDAIRNIFINCGLDEKNIGKEKWNPLSVYIQPGNIVLIKPNMVNNKNPAEKDIKRGLECMITHPSVVRCVFDYVYIALKGRGTIIIADAPVQDCEFDKLLESSGYGVLFEYLKSKETDTLHIETGDLRNTILKLGRHKEQIGNSHQIYNSKVVDLGGASYFEPVKHKKRLRITNYAASETVSHHKNGKHEYCISDALLQADVVINLPKPKTHRIAGYTAALKNMIGISTKKEFLPHHMKGSVDKNGDEYEASDKFLKWMNSTGNDIKNWGLAHHNLLVTDIFDEFSRLIGKKLDQKEADRKKFGMWYGNDTIWRTILDINRIVLYCDKNGNMCEQPQRRIIHIGDMIASGEKEGPLKPSYKKVGGILFSDNAVTFDLSIVKLMGFDYHKFPVLLNALEDHKLYIEGQKEIILQSNAAEFTHNIKTLKNNFHYEPASGWKEVLKK